MGTLLVIICGVLLLPSIYCLAPIRWNFTDFFQEDNIVELACTANIADITNVVIVGIGTVGAAITPLNSNVAPHQCSYDPVGNRTNESWLVVEGRCDYEEDSGLKTFTLRLQDVKERTDGFEFDATWWRCCASGESADICTPNVAKVGRLRMNAARHFAFSLEAVESVIEPTVESVTEPNAPSETVIPVGSTSKTPAFRRDMCDCRNGLIVLCAILGMLAVLLIVVLKKLVKRIHRLENSPIYRVRP